MAEKDFKARLIVNWKTGKCRLVSPKRKSKITPMEVPINIDLKIKFPEKKEINVKGEIEVDDVKATDITLEYLKGEDE